MGNAFGEGAVGSAVVAVPPQTRHDLDEQQMRHRLLDALFDAPQPIVTVGRYQLLEKIGSGGLGVVYAAYDPQLDRRIALKLVQHGKLGPDATQRMHREAQAMAKLNHPNVVTVHDVGTQGDGVFIAMELVDGVTLKQWIGAKPRNWREVRDALVQAGEGLHAAHERGLIHRDFKPANVLVDGRGRARVLDFGLARFATDAPHLGPDSSQTSMSPLELELTRAGAVIGTPPYMAPEQFAGRADALSDQWAFCVTAYEAFYGERPFKGNDLQQIRGAIMTGRLPPGSGTSSVPGWIHRALAKGLTVNPQGRHPSMASLISALQRDRRSRRLQWLGIIGVLLLVAVTAGLTAWLVRPEPSEQERQLLAELESRARAAAEEGHYVYPPADDPDARTAWAAITDLEELDGPITPQAQERAEALRREFATRLAEIGDEYYGHPGGVPFASDFYAAALLFDPEHSRARERSTLTPGELATLRKKADEAAFTEAELVGAEPLAALAETDASKRKTRLARLYKKRHPAASTSLHLERLLGSDAPAILHRSQLSPPSPTRAKKATSKSDDEQTTDTHDEGDGSRDGSGTASGKRDRRGAAEEVSAANSAVAAGRYDEAEQAYHRALGKDRRNVAALRGLSDLYFERGAYQKALKYARRAVEVAPRKGALRMQLGDTLFKVHRYDEARSEYTAAKKLGHPGAKQALARLDARVGRAQ